MSSLPDERSRSSRLSLECSRPILSSLVHVFSRHGNGILAESKYGCTDRLSVIVREPAELCCGITVAHFHNDAVLTGNCTGDERSRYRVEVFHLGKRVIWNAPDVTVSWYVMT